MQYPPNAASSVHALAAVNKRWSRLPFGAQNLIARLLSKTPSAEAFDAQFYPWTTDYRVIHWSTGQMDAFNERGQKIKLEWSINESTGLAYSRQVCNYVVRARLRRQP